MVPVSLPLGRISTRSSVKGFSLLMVVGVFAPALGCRGGAVPESAPSVPSLDSAGGAMAPPVFEELGGRPLASTVLAADWALADCAFRVDGEVHELSVWDLLDGVGQGAVLDLGRVLESVDGVGSESSSAPLSAPWTRAYALVPRARWRATLFLEDSGGERPVLYAGLRGSGRRAVSLEAPDLLRCLRRAAFRALWAAGEPPRPEKPWHPAALLGLLGPAAAPPPDFVEGGEVARTALRTALLAAAKRAGREERERLARSFLPFASHFAPSDPPSLGEENGLASRLLPLATLAAGGDAAALEEILVLSLEYFGREDVPSDANPALAPLRGAGAKPGSVLSEVRRRRGECTYEPRKGWTLGAARP
jgi:hypothetical protein